MASSFRSSNFSSFKLQCCLFWVLVGVASAQLSSNFYSSSCPNALSTIQSAVQAAVNNEARMGASLLRLHFHDCFVNLGGPSWTVMLGRRDSTTASQSAANSNIPAPTLNLNQLITSFSNQGLSTQDLVALSGAHTIGQARCTTFRSRIYNDTNINATFATSLQANCPSNGGDNNLSPLDTTPTSFDNAYFTDLLSFQGVLHTDQELFNGNNGTTDSLVSSYSSSSSTFFTDFGNAMVNMGNIGVLTGTSGEIRTNCRVTN